MYTYKIGISAQEHDDFVKASSQTNLLQSASWAKVKDNWDNERIGFYKNDQLVASASILIKPLPLGMTMLYIPRGPIMDYHDQELLQFVLTSLKQFAKTKKALFIKFDPSLFLVQAQIGEDRKEQQETLGRADRIIRRNDSTAFSSKYLQGQFQRRTFIKKYTPSHSHCTKQRHSSPVCWQRTFG